MGTLIKVTIRCNAASDNGKHSCYLTVQPEGEQHEEEQEAPEGADGKACHHFWVHNER